MQTAPRGRKPDKLQWSGLIPDDEWALYHLVLGGLVAEGIPFALGGGFAFSFHSLRWRDTKDIDIYLLPSDRQRAIGIAEQAGFKDLYPDKPYDRAWIHRGMRDDLIVDIIWAMANQRAQVDEEWLKRSPEVELRGLRLKMLAAEELIWAKLYVVQRDRCDWPDLFNILFVRGPTLDWRHLLARVNDDARLLGGLLNVFSWICPGVAAELPAWIWKPLGLSPAARNGKVDPHRVALLDRRDWFGPKDGAEKGEAIPPKQD